MPLAAGARLGVYEIVAMLGSGGMGEVYRARDGKLQRDVAIKVLPDLLARDPDRLARFEREAQVLASLNQPHIAQIYGFEDSTGVKALVMELVDGPTLADRQAAGPVPVTEAVPIARQIADALEAAHEKGIVHRDLKPANIKLTADGQVKVLDFGLAKALDPGAATLDLANSPTLTSPAMTQGGMLLGTAAYMSPEQARGQLVDRRADIWAFGVVLFEMLSGKRLFDGPTLSDTLASVLRQEVDWSKLPASTPATIVALLRRCLDRDPKHRLRDIGEARIVFEQGIDELTAAPATARGAAAPPPRRSVARASQVAAVVTLVVITTAITWRVAKSRPAPVDSVRVSITPPADSSLNLAGHTAIAMSRDGSTLALTASTKAVSRLYVRPLNEFEPRPIAGTSGASSPFFSPDGKWIGFFADGKLKKVPTAGGPVIVLADCRDNRGAVWADDDTIVVSPEPVSPLMRVSASGGTPQAVSQLDEQKHERTHRWPALLPGGKSALVTVGSLEHPDDYDEATIEAIRLDTGARQVVLKGGRMATYIATGHLVYLHGKVLYAAPFDAGRLQVTGAPVPLIDGVAGDTTTGAADYSVSTNGTIAYVPGDPTGGEHMLAWVDMKGAATMIDFPTSLYYDPKISQDGRRVTLSIIESASTRNIAVLDPHRGSSTKLTFRGMNRTPLWSPDGRSVYYISYDTASNASVLMRSASDGSGTPERLRELRGQAYLEDITSDGSAVVFSISAPGTGSGRGAITVGLRSVIARLSVANPASEPVIVVTGTADVFNAAVSPNGQWIAYASQETGRPEVLAQSFTSAGGRQPISTAGGTEPRWSPDGKTLYYVNGDQMMAVSLEPGPALLPGRPRTLFSGVVPISVDSAETYHLTPTGDRFLMMRSDTRTSAPAEVRAIFGWFPTIGR